MKVIAIFNHAGGVGKSSLTRDLGYLLANKHNKSVLLIDGDQSASLSAMLGVIAPSRDQSFYRSVVSDRIVPLPDPIEVCGMDLIPGTKHFVSLEAELARTDFDSRLRDALPSLKKTYDYVFIDCPPSMGPITRLAFSAASSAVVPLETSMKSMLAIRGVWDAVDSARLKNPDFKVSMYVPTMGDVRTLASLRVLSEFEDALSDRTPLSSPLSYRPGPHSRSLFAAKPVPMLDPAGAATAELEVVVSEFLEVFEGVGV